MQSTKDSFLNHLATRLTELDSSRTVTIDGITRPAVMACENERPELSRSFENCYCVDWEEASQVGQTVGVQSLTCSIAYWTTGSAEMSGVDRGRQLTAMDELLKRILSGRHTPRLDFSVDPAVESGSNVFWDEPKFEATAQEGMKLRRTAKVNVYFVAEAVK